jgi:neurocan core protein
MTSYFTSSLVLIIIASISDVAHGRHHRRSANKLDILPKGHHTFPIGKNSFFTCVAHVHNPKLVKDLKWLAPNGKEIPQDDRVYTEELPGDAGIMLFIKDLNQDDSGEYVCQGTYANNEEMNSKVKISTFIGITWEDAPEDQYAVIHKDSKIRCVVKARPAATVDWLKESLILSTGKKSISLKLFSVVKILTKWTCQKSG